MKQKAPQIALFTDSDEPITDTTLYKFIEIAETRKEHYFSGALSFDKMTHYIRENKSSGIMIHIATGEKTNARSGRVYNLNTFPVINVFSQPGFTPPEAGFFTSSEPEPG